MIKRHRNEKLIRAAGMRLRELREARGLSQEKVLFETNIHLSNIENGRQDIYHRYAGGIVQYLRHLVRGFF